MRVSYTKLNNLKLFLFLTVFSFEAQIELFLELIVGAHCLNEFERKNATHVLYVMCVFCMRFVLLDGRERDSTDIWRVQRESKTALCDQNIILYKCVPTYKMIQLILSGHRTLEMTRLARTHVTKVQYKIILL